jgi:histidyl-tRNA synthetase
LILGDAEAEGGTVQLKWMKTQEQITLSREELGNRVDELKERIDRERL